MNKYIAGLIKGKNQKPIIVNGMPDHIHAFIGLKPSTAISEIVRDIKNNSTNFINENKNIGFFLVVAGWEDFKTLGKLKNAFDIPRNSQIDFDNIQPEFSHPVNFQNPILKESK